MKITEQKTMKAYRNNGRLIYILKMSLPFAEDGARAFSEFNSFYKAAKDAFLSLASALSEAADPSLFEVGRISVSFEHEMRDGLLVIMRHFSISRGNEHFERCEEDFYESGLGVFVKPPKNVKKQRFNPLRKGEKYNKKD